MAFVSVGWLNAQDEKLTKAKCDQIKTDLDRLKIGIQEDNNYLKSSRCIESPNDGTCSSFRVALKEAQQEISYLKTQDELCRDLPRPPIAGTVGSACRNDESCGGLNESCFASLCQCKPGYIVCGNECVDIASDQNHCGSCSNRCSGPCNQGTCKTPAQTTGKPVVSAPFTVSAPAAGCSVNAWESHQSVSLNDGTLFQSDAAKYTEWSWASADQITKWSAAVRVPAVSPRVAAGDTWTASSGYSGLEYVAARTVINSTASASGIAATSPAHMHAGKWDYPDNWAIPPDEAGDGVSIAFDEGGTSLWLVASNGSRIYDSSQPISTVLKNIPDAAILWDTKQPSHDQLQKGVSLDSRSYLYLFPNCKKRPGGAACPRATFPIPPSYGGNGQIVDFIDLQADLGVNLQSGFHTTVVVNPCTHHALVSFIGADGNVLVRAVDQTGGMTPNSGAWVLDNVGTIHGNSSCVDKSGGFLHGFDLQCQPTATNCGGNTNVCPNSATTVSPICKDLAKKYPAPGCDREVPRVQLATKVTQNNGQAQCLLYAGWDKEYETPVTSSTGQAQSGRRFKSSLTVLDVTDESSPKVFAMIPDTEPRPGDETWNSTPVVSRFNDNVAWFFFYGTQNNAFVSLNAYVDNHLDLRGRHGVTVSPTMPNATTLTGDNLSETLGGLPGGVFFATWAEIVNKCKIIRGATVVP